MRILVIEDDPTVGQYVKRGLEEHRWAVDLATDGEECHENQSPNAPLNSSSHTSTGLTPANATSMPNTPSAPQMAATGRAMSVSVSRMRV